MTIGELIIACDNISMNTELMIFDTVWDFDNSTSNWKTCRAGSLVNSMIHIAKFHIYTDFIAIALA